MTTFYEFIQGNVWVPILFGILFIALLIAWDKYRKSKREIQKPIPIKYSVFESLASQKENLLKEMEISEKKEKQLIEDMEKLNEYYKEERDKLDDAMAIAKGDKAIYVNQLEMIDKMISIKEEREKWRRRSEKTKKK